MFTVQHCSAAYIKIPTANLVLQSCTKGFNFFFLMTIISKSVFHAMLKEHGHCNCIHGLSVNNFRDHMNKRFK